MKNVLIVADSLSMGGLEKTLIDLCNNLDYTKYNVDLYLFNEGRDLLPKLNEKVGLLPDSPYFANVFNRPVGQSVKELIKQKQFALAFYRVLRFIKARFKMMGLSSLDWHFQKKTMLKINKEYDSAIAFAEGSACYFVADCIKAKVKSMWIHTDISKIITNKKLDNMAFTVANSICTVSNNSANALKENYPDFADKIKVFTLPSLFDFERLEKLSQEPNEMSKDSVNILSVGRLVELKGFHLCVPACKKLIDEGYNIKWYVVGDGPQREELESLINKNNLQEHFILLGSKTNPYTYINSSTICVQPSSYEGLGLVIYEEKLFKKAVVASNIPAFLEMIEDHTNGLIIERNSESIYKAVKELLSDKELLEKLGKAPAINFKEKSETIKEIERLLS